MIDGELGLESRSLPSVPAAIVALDALPTTSNGKLDRKALPAPVFEAAVGRAAETPTEKVIAELFAETLGRAEPAGADDDFFTLGGDSLLAVHLMMLIRERLGRDGQQPQREQRRRHDPPG